MLAGDALELRQITSNWAIVPEMLARFRKLHREHVSGYMGEKRKAMVRDYQYDVKNAAHLIRLLRMGSEFIATGHLQVYRSADVDALELIDLHRRFLDLPGIGAVQPA